MARQSPSTVDALMGLINNFTSVIDLDMMVRSCNMFVKKKTRMCLRQQGSVFEQCI